MEALDAKDALRMRLHRSGLLRPLSSVEDVVRQCIGIQTQYSQSLPVAVAARTKPKPPDWFSRALDFDGPLRKTWTVRWTMHTVHRDDIPLLVSAAGRHLYRRYLKGMTEHFKLAEKAIHERQERVWNILRQGPLTRKELHDRVPEFKTMESTGWGWDVAGLAHEGRLYVSSHLGQTTFVATDPPKLMDEHEAQVELLRRYLGAYGPASVHDFARWSGLYLSAIRPAFAALEGEIEWRELANGSKVALLRDSDHGGQGTARVKLLAKFDPYVMAHFDKSLFLSDKDYGNVFRPAGQVEATILVGGRVAGTWRAERNGRRLSLRLWPLRRLASPTLRELEKHAQKLQVALGADSVEVLQ